MMGLSYHVDSTDSTIQMSEMYIWINSVDDEHDHNISAMVYVKIVFDIKTKSLHCWSLSQDNRSTFDWGLAVNLTGWLVQLD